LQLIQYIPTTLNDAFSVNSYNFSITKIYLFSQSFRAGPTKFTIKLH
jgi:hypothetical protein